MESSKMLILIVAIACVLFLLIIPGIPFTDSQFYYQSTDLNYTKLSFGDYNGMFVVVDGNKLSVTDLNGWSGDCGWDKNIIVTNGIIIGCS